jgi:glycosyltransferase involved in cell wall biosynthesis
MHVLYVIDSLDRPGGAEQALAATAPRLVERGLRLDVAYLLDRDGFQDELRAAGVGVHLVPGRSRRDNVVRLTSLIRRLSPDLVHTTLYEADLAGRVAAGVARVPVVSSLVNAAYGPEHVGAPHLTPWKVRAAQGLDAASARLVRRFHAISHHVADTMARRLLIPRSRIDVVPRGRDPLRLATRTPANRAAVRAELGLTDATPVVLAAARHEYQKGLDVLVTALGTVRRLVPGTVLLVAGRFGEESDRLRAAADAAGVADAVRLLGARTDVPELLGAGDVFVAPSRWEGLGSAALEAMGVGVPLVVSDVPALRELVGGADCARLVAPDAPDPLAAAIVTSLRDRADAETRARAGQRRFGDRFDLDRVVDRTADFYRRAAGCSRAR